MAYTQLSPMATPGKRYSFPAKASPFWRREEEYDQLAELRRDDNELLEIITALLTRGILN